MASTMDTARRWGHSRQRGPVVRQYQDAHGNASLEAAHQAMRTAQSRFFEIVTLPTT